MCCGQLTPLLSWQTATPHAWHHQLSQGRNSPRKEESHTKCQPASPQLAPQPAFFLPCSFLACNTALTNLILNHYHTGALHAWTREREERGGKTEQKRSAKGTHISIKYTHSFFQPLRALSVVAALLTHHHRFCLILHKGKTGELVSVFLSSSLLLLSSHAHSHLWSRCSSPPSASILSLSPGTPGLSLHLAASTAPILVLADGLQSGGSSKSDLESLLCA